MHTLNFFYLTLPPYIYTTCKVNLIVPHSTIFHILKEILKKKLWEYTFQFNLVFKNFI